MKNQCNFVRKSYLDVLRNIAIFMVLFNHTGSKGFAIFTTVAPQSVSYWIYLFGAIFIKIAVPIFFMISGALLLERENEVVCIPVSRGGKMEVIKEESML